MRKIVIRRKSMLAVLALLCAPQFVAAQTSEEERKPVPGFSIYWDFPEDRVPNGTNFIRIRRDFETANIGDEAAFKLFFEPGANASFKHLRGQQGAIFGHAALKAMYESCIGPYSFDESNSWVQLSWVCRTDSASPLGKYYKFERSAELGLTIWFKNGRINEIHAMESWSIPGQQTIPLDAYETMTGKR